MMDTQTHTDAPDPLTTLRLHFEAQIHDLNTRLAESSSGIHTFKEPKLPSPDKFNGNLRDLKNFIASVENIITLQPSRFPTEEIKVRYVGTLLTGDALTWFRTQATPPSFMPNKLPAFWVLLSATFGDPCAQWTARNKLKLLKQGKLSCVQFTTKFKHIALESGYDNIALLQMYHDGLNDSIKDALSQSVDVPSELDIYAQLCIRIDNRQFARRMEKHNSNSGNSGMQFRPTTKVTQPYQSYPSGPVPMQLDSIQTYSKLTPEEKQKRMSQGLCLYCGFPGHIAKACPKKSKPSHPNARVQTH
jgi:hypothetical protein